MKKIFLLSFVVFGFVFAGMSQTNPEKQKIKIERPGFKEKIKGESAHMIMMSSSTHPAYGHRIVKHTTHKTHHTAKHIATPKKHIAVKRTAHHVSVVHYKKIKRVKKNGEWKVKYKK